MTTLDNKKYQILESLDGLDQNQTEKVLEYIKDLVQITERDERYTKMKREAMRQISQALGRTHRFNTTF